ncbi:MAG: hypothetical protein ABR499_12225 [Gemmatimonadaceae bacterium]
MTAVTAIHKPLPSRSAFVARVARSLAIGSGIVAVSLGIGVLGYHGLAGLSWTDALLNAAMILTGMGPVNEIATTRGKLFATCYALFSGIVFLSVAALVFAPVMHRFLHRFHLELSSGVAGQTSGEASGDVAG